MKKWSKNLLCVVFSFIFVFMSFGYAKIADALTVSGKLEYKFEGIKITSVSLVSSSNMNPGAYDKVSPTNVMNTVNLTGNNATVKYKITFLNTSSRYSYTYKQIQCDTTLEGYHNSFYSNKAADNKFTVTLTNEDGSTFAPGTEIKKQETRVIYAEYKFGRSVTKNTPLTFLLNYQFGIHVASMGEAAVEKTLTAFLNVLNTESDYAELILHIDDKFQGQHWQSNYIGNVSQAGSGTASNQAKADAAVVEGLIGSGLTLSIEGITKNVTVLIKRENLDNNEKTGDAFKAEQIEQQKNNNGTWWNPNDDFYEDVVVATTTGTGCEMTIYMTPNNLNKKIEEGEYAGDSGWAEVFVSVTTCTNNGVISSTTNNYTSMSDWYLIGDIYEGIANIVTYEGDNGNGSFVTDNWKSIQKTYKVTEKYSYTIAKDQKIGDIIRATDTKANDEFNRLRNLANAAIQYIDDNSNYFGIAEYRQPIQTLRDTLAKANAMTVNRNTFRSSLIPILRELENAVYPFQNFIQ